MKILIFTASPMRDSIVDSLLTEELEKMGHEVSIRPCLREHRAAFEDTINEILQGGQGPHSGPCNG